MHHFRVIEFTDKEFSRKISGIKKIILHCSDSDNPKHDDISVIKAWHLERGFLDVGYHFFIKKDGKNQIGRPIYMIGAHCIGHNIDSVGLCLSGKKIFSDNQLKATNILCHTLIQRFRLSVHDVYPHNHFDANKTCPNFLISKIWSFDK
jgi:N-acetyl-anhydromuramyl-L-alanine amidase AmpD